MGFISPTFCFTSNVVKASSLQKWCLWTPERERVARCSDVRFLCNWFLASIRVSKEPCTKKRDKDHWFKENHCFNQELACPHAGPSTKNGLLFANEQFEANSVGGEKSMRWLWEYKLAHDVWREIERDDWRACESYVSEFSGTAVLRMHLSTTVVNSGAGVTDQNLESFIVSVSVGKPISLSYRFLTYKAEILFIPRVLWKVNWKKYMWNM